MEPGAHLAAVAAAHLAAVARRNLAGFPAVEVVTAAFADWPLPSEPFDPVLAATAFHWIDPPEAIPVRPIPAGGRSPPEGDPRRRAIPVRPDQPAS